MKHSTKAVITATVAALLASLFATAAAAEPAHDMDHKSQNMTEEDNKAGHDGGMGGCRMMGGGARRGKHGAMKMDDRHFAHLKTELKITETQFAAWETYIKAAKARGDAMKTARETHMKAMKSGDAIQRLDGHITAMQTMLDALKELKPATIALFGALNDDQKTKANLSLDGGGCMM